MYISSCDFIVPTFVWFFCSFVLFCKFCLRSLLCGFLRVVSGCSLSQFITKYIPTLNSNLKFAVALQILTSVFNVNMNNYYKLSYNLW